MKKLIHRYNEKLLPLSSINISLFFFDVSMPFWEMWCLESNLQLPPLLSNYISQENLEIKTSETRKVNVLSSKTLFALLGHVSLLLPCLWGLSLHIGGWLLHLLSLSLGSIIFGRFSLSYLIALNWHWVDVARVNQELYYMKSVRIEEIASRPLLSFLLILSLTETPLLFPQNSIFHLYFQRHT